MGYANMKKRVDVSGGIERQTKINDAKFMFEYEFDRDISYKDTWHICEGVEVGDDLPIRIYNERYSAANGFTALFAIKQSDRIYTGDMLYDEKEERFWLCTEIYDKDEVYYQGKLLRCVEPKLKWQNADKEIVEYPIFEMNSTQYNSGETSDRTMTLGTSQHLIKIIADENTIHLEHGTRFFWDRNTQNPTVFKVTQVDTTTLFYDKGLINITVAEDQYNPDTDNIEKWLCNYYEMSDPITVMYSGQPSIRIGGTKTVKVNTDKKVTWAISPADFATITPDESSAKIKCVNNNKIVGKEIVVTATLDNGVSDDLKLMITGGV